MQRLLEPGNYSNSCQTASLLIYNEVSKRVIKRTWEVVKCQGSINGGKSSGDSRPVRHVSCNPQEENHIFFGGEMQMCLKISYLSHVR